MTLETSTPRLKPRNAATDRAPERREIGPCLRPAYSRGVLRGGRWREYLAQHGRNHPGEDVREVGARDRRPR